MKLYLIYFFESSIFENNKFLYSHFDFVHQYKFLIIRVYLYYIGFYNFLSDFFFEINEDLRLDFESPPLGLKGDNFKDEYISIFSVFAVFKLISGYLFECDVIDHFSNFFSSFFSLDFFFLKKILYSKSFLKIEKKNKIDFLFFFSILIYLSKNLHRAEDDGYLNSILENIFISVISFLWLRPVFFSLKLYILALLGYMFPLFKGFLTVRFYLLSNDGVSAKFLSRFIAVRFSYGFVLKEVVDPIKADLLETMDFLNGSFLLNKNNENAFCASRAKVFYKSVFKRLFLMTFSIYWKYFGNYFKSHFC
jgi:hypothetical protein